MGIIKCFNVCPCFVGENVIVFNSIEWAKIGDIGDNSMLWQNAKINKVRYENFVWLADVTFENGKISHGHYVEGIKKI